MGKEDCARSWDCRIFDNCLCLGEHEKCYKTFSPRVEVWDSVSDRASLYDPNGITGLCEKALSDECPYAKRIICIKGSHDICLTGKFQESREGQLKKIKDKEDKKYRPANPHARIVVLTDGRRGFPVDIGG
jgi:hypothetical protein